MANWPAYQAIRAEAVRLGLPRHHAADLTIIDRGVLAKKDAPLRFGWMVYDTGTNLWRPLKPSQDYVEAWHYCLGYGSNSQAHFYWFDGARLREVSGPELLDLLTGAPRDETAYQRALSEYERPSYRRQDLTLYLADQAARVCKPTQLAA